MCSLISLDLNKLLYGDLGRYEASDGEVLGLELCEGLLVEC